MHNWLEQGPDICIELVSIYIESILVFPHKAVHFMLQKEEQESGIFLNDCIQLWKIELPKTLGLEVRF